MKNQIRTLLTTCTAAALSLSLFSAPALAEKKNKWTIKADETIVEFAANASGDDFMPDSNPKDFDILGQALMLTGVVGIFNGDDYTVFAPNDQAFWDLTGTDNDDAAIGALVGLIGMDGIAAVLAYHVTEGVRNSRSVTRAKQITMLDGDTISGRSGNIEANFSTAGILSADNRVADGMVHVIDTVLLPIDPTPPAE